ncbi:MAG: lipoyl(octanoyl) transferase LipB [Bacteroidales bacterium]|jgi:lipoyl(octanoyl) transferase|nr:lipoyl(octanoyl) transferase LipB [Bacteroidales bacterium]
MLYKEIQYIDWGLIHYKEAWEKQKELFDELVELKSDFENPNKEDIIQRFILCEHPHVYTLGKNGQSNNMLINDEFMKKINASYHHIDRGGDITYHGPGQIVGYPILDLQQLRLSLKDYVHCIEEMIILTMKEYQLNASRMQGATGVWVDADKPNPRKICAIGIRSCRYVTMHGFAFNINTDLSYFSYINPCGFVDKGVTSLSKELRRSVEIEEIKQKLYHHFQSLILP